MRYRFWIVVGILTLALGGAALYASHKIQLSCFEQYEVRLAEKGTLYICGILFPPD